MSLHDRKVSREQGKVFIEGLRLCEDALVSGIVPEIIIIQYGKEQVLDGWKVKYPVISGAEVLIFPENLFSKLSSTMNPQGIAMVVKEPEMASDELLSSENGRFIVLEHLQDPGNMGTIIRMADAFAYTGVIYTQDSVDPFNEKVLRASMGSCFHIPLQCFSSSEEIINALQKHHIPSIGAHLKGEDLRSAKLPKSAALWIGNEANGLLDTTSSCCDILIKIPMPGRAESLNAASAASILGYLLANTSES